MKEKRVLHTEQLSVGYGKNVIVRDILLQANAGELLCLIGPNGAGKSTILKTLIRQLTPIEGVVCMDGHPLQTLSYRELARESAAVLTGRVNPELMRCEDVIAAGRYPYTGRLGLLSASDRAVIDEVIRLVGVDDIRTLDFDRISDGQRQRVMLARALCQEPKLLVMDEPTSFLDIHHKLEFLQLLRGLMKEKQLAVIMSLHELDLAQKYADTLVCVRDGRIDRIGSPEEVFTDEYICSLYNLRIGSYQCLYGTPEPAGCKDPPEIFVIGGSGSGIPVYRQLQRLGIPFAVGVLQENDIDTPVAKALASAVFLEAAYEEISDVTLSKALEALKKCRSLICCQNTFGSMNQKNQQLLEYAAERGMLLDAACLGSYNTGAETGGNGK